MRKAEIIREIENIHGELYAKADFWIKRADFAIKEKLPEIEQEKALSYAIAHDYGEKLLAKLLREIRKK